MRAALGTGFVLAGFVLAALWQRERERRRIVFAFRPLTLEEQLLVLAVQTRHLARRLGMALIPATAALTTALTGYAAAAVRAGEEFNRAIAKLRAEVDG